MKPRAASLAKSLAHPAKTTVAAIVSLLAARLLGLPEFYWAPISTMIIVYAAPDAALLLAWQRLVGTALGSAAGALLAYWFGPSVVAYGAGLFGLGLLCALLRLDLPAYRFAGITLTVILFVAHAEPAWVIGIHRFCEVSIGIVIGVVTVALWPERQKEQPRNNH